MTFCVTGNRPEKFPFDYSDTASKEMTAYFAYLKNIAFECLDAGYDTFITGMARGVDLDFAIEIIKMKKEYKRFSDVKIVCAIPYRAQSAGYDTESKKKYNYIKSKADSVAVLSEKYEKDCFLDRNRYMVDNSEYVVAFLNENQYGGTTYTVNYAVSKGKKVKKISLNDFI